MPLDPRHRFDSLVIGAGNRLAAAAARAVAEAPATTYNPLYIYGGPGLGKTHLLGAVAELASLLQPDLEIEYLTLDELRARWMMAISTGETALLAQRFDRVDMLLLDDVQFLAGQREAQAELLRLATSLMERGNQLVMTSDRPPSEIAGLDERLVSRLGGGLVVDVAPPDFETRVAILRVVAAERGLSFEPGVLEEVGRVAYPSVRELLGALTRVQAVIAIGERAQAIDVPRILGTHSTPSAPMHRTEARASGTEFESFLSEMQTVVQQQMERWQVRLQESIAYWAGEGYRTAVLERALELPREPDVSGLMATFAAAVEHLRGLATQAAAVDPALGGHAVFRDPERMAEAEDLVEQALQGTTPPGGPSPSFQREGFEVGSSNQLAVHAADAVISEPGRKYNPLLVYGPSGVGKTHLVHAIGNAIAAQSGGATVVACVHAQQLIDELIAAIQGGTVERWRTRYRSAGVLVVDDVQFVAGKERTQEEFFLVFNAMIEAGQQILLTSDRPPAEIPELEARLRSRFEGGLSTPIQSPDRELRERLFARYLLAAGRPTDPSLLRALGEHPIHSVREIAGLVHRLGAAADAAGEPLNATLARAELGLTALDERAPVRRSSQGIGDVAVFLDREKVIWDWPDASARLIEELR
ncbi:MAG: ATP-binding protein [Gemmatimonadaceae bacterium]|nr:ATP-binding protein [Gemmatimonadaceae bacterium]